MDRFLFGGRGLSTVFHVRLILLPPTWCGRRAPGPLRVHPFFIWRPTTLASCSLDWDPVLSRKSIEGGRKGGQRKSERRENRKEREVGRSVGGEEGVCATLCEGWKEGWREKMRCRGKWKIGRVGEGEREREHIATVCGIFKNFFFLFAGSNFQVAAAASPHRGVMYRWLCELHTYTDHSPAWPPPPPCSPPSVSILLCGHFMSPCLYIQVVHCLYSTHLFYLFIFFTQLQFLPLLLPVKRCGYTKHFLPPYVCPVCCVVLVYTGGRQHALIYNHRRTWDLKV